MNLINLKLKKSPVSVKSQIKFWWSCPCLIFQKSPSISTISSNSFTFPSIEKLNLCLLYLSFLANLIYTRRKIMSSPLCNLAPERGSQYVIKITDLSSTSPLVKLIKVSLLQPLLISKKRTTKFGFLVLFTNWLNITPHNLVKLIFSYLLNSNFHLRVKHDLYRNIFARFGLPQGSHTSPVSFLISLLMICPPTHILFWQMRMIPTCFRLI